MMSTDVSQVGFALIPFYFNFFIFFLCLSPRDLLIFSVRVSPFYHFLWFVLFIKFCSLLPAVEPFPLRWLNLIEIPDIRWRRINGCMWQEVSVSLLWLQSSTPAPAPLAPSTSMSIVDDISQLRQSSGNSSASSGSLAGLSDTDTAATLPGPAQGFIIALHRKMVSNQVRKENIIMKRE